jgi:hypothetical protein
LNSNSDTPFPEDGVEKIGNIFDFSELDDARNGACVDKAQKAKWSSEICSFIRLAQSEVLIVYIIQVELEQQQPNLGSFAQVWH